MTTDDRAGCPPQDLLIEAASPGADRLMRERVAEHLITCASCADEFRLLQALAPWASEHASLVARPDAAPAVSATRRRAAMTWAYAAAAVWALVALGLTIQIRRLAEANRVLETRLSAPASLAIPHDVEARLADQQQTIGALEQRLRAAESPGLNPPIVDLDAADSLRNAGRAEPATIPAGTGPVVFVLNTAHVRPAAIFEVDILDTAGRVAWTGSGLRQSADGTLTLIVPRSMVERSSRVRLYTRAPDRRALVEEYVLPARR